MAVRLAKIPESKNQVQPVPTQVLTPGTGEFGWMVMVPNQAPLPIPLEVTPAAIAKVAPAAEPMQPAKKGNMCLMLIPYIAGSVTPNQAEAQAGKAVSLIFSCLRFMMPNIKQAAPWAMLEIAKIGKNNDPPKVPVFCTITAFKLWCKPVTTNGA